jgi:hypothetical protein
MPSARLVYTDPWGSGLRPYLALALSGVNGTPLNVIGLLDTGADLSSLPVSWAVLMGYTNATLTHDVVTVANGVQAPCFRPAPPCGAALIGSSVAFPMAPTFMIGATVQNQIWGRLDVMAAFKTVAFEEPAKTFVLEWDDSPSASTGAANA